MRRSPVWTTPRMNDTAWFDKIDASGGAVFFAAGVFYYFLKEQVRTLVQKMADAFPGGVLVFDAANEKAVRLMLKTWIKDAEIKDVGAYFAVSDAKAELSPWDPSAHFQQMCIRDSLQSICKRSEIISDTIS